MQVHITQLFTYPIKSCAGIALQQSPIGYGGLAWDREWVVVDHNGKMLTQRTLPSMALIQPSLTEQQLLLNAPDMPELSLPLDQSELAATQVQIWDDLTLGTDQGQAVATWLSQFLQQPCRLLRVHSQAQRSLSQKWVTAWLQNDCAPSDALGLEQTRFGFADGFPFLICNEASLTALNRWITPQGKATMGMLRFRPNIVIQGLEAYEEDHVFSWEGDGVHFATLKACTRCALPNVDPATAVAGTQPLQALLETRRSNQGVTFGVNAALYQLTPQANLRVGQSLHVTFNF